MSVVPLDELGTDAIAVAALAAAAATATGSVPIDQLLTTTTAGIIVLGVLP